jgi:murein DD-endopeptidase MepM/ murein hydrolase activator NlpD
MLEFSESFLFKVRLLIGSAFIIFALLLLPLFTSLIVPDPKVQAANTTPTVTAASTDLQDSPNVITSGMFSAADGISKSASSASKSINNTANSIASATADAGTSLANGVVASASFTGHAAAGGASFAVHGIASSASLMGRGIGSSVGFAAHTTGSIFGVITNTKPPAIGNVIRPSDSEYVEVINDGTPPLPASAPMPATQAAAAPAPQPQIDTSAQWPIHGAITTEFGASDWPYQLHHTGIDIADSQRAGVTPIHPFKPGRVIQVIHSNVSLGNHVIVDNGNGITSVYGHMYKTNVQVGEQVDKNSVLGWEGSTGASTGPHVHFEIYLNGALQNPHNYIPGHP